MNTKKLIAGVAVAASAMAALPLCADTNITEETPLPADSSSHPAAVAPVKDAKALKYSPMIFGHFIEHFDTQVYGGLRPPLSAE